MEDLCMLKPWVHGGRWVVGGLAVFGLGAATVAACSSGSPSEQVVQHNQPAESAPSEQVTVHAATPLTTAQPGSVRASDKSITSQEVERELNRLEAELR
jgi:hypothetical protein